MFYSEKRPDGSISAEKIMIPEGCDPRVRWQNKTVEKNWSFHALIEATPTEYALGVNYTGAHLLLTN